MTLISDAPPKASLLGAFDRFNYGDLLFPLVVKNELAAHSARTEVAVHALIQSDFSRYGALKTSALRAMYAPGALRKDDVVIFAGGGTIGVDWAYMHANLLGEAGNKALYFAKRLFGDAVVNGFSRRHFGSRAPFPWVAGPEDFPVRVKVAYNAVGGSEFSKLAPAVQARTLERLSQASYLSVRDLETQRLFAAINGKVSVEVSPDSAVLMSEQYPLETLVQRSSAELLSIIDAGPYVCFQANLGYSRRHASQIVATLESIYENHGLRAVLLPIGRYVGLDDQVALRDIMTQLRTPAAIVSDEASIWEIMHVIARAGLFLGTSLHGNVTSQSFAVPHIGLSEEPCKLDYYLESWDLPEQARCVPLAEASKQAGLVLAVPAAQRLAKRADLIARAHANFAKMGRACGLQWT